MKKKIGIIIILIIEFLLLSFYSLNVVITLPSSFKPAIDICEYFYTYVVIKPCLLLNLDSYSFGKLCTLLIVNIVFVAVYFIIFSTIGAISKSRKRKKIYRVVKIPYELNEAEEERFSIKNYKKKFPIRRVVSLIIPTTFLSLFILMRYDSQFSLKANFLEVGMFDIYSKFIDPIIQKIINNDATINNLILKVFTNERSVGYADIINKLPASFAWVEYIVLVLLCALVLLLWYGFFSLINLLFKKKRFARKMKKARENYILKKDYSEYKYRMKHAKEYSSKSEKFMSLVESESEEEQVIANSKNSKKLKRENAVPQDYYDDLGNGVRDLGVGEIEKEELDKAKIEREVRYISDKDFDITLEAEPVIEVVEDDEIDPIHQQSKEDELFYEKYQQDDIDIKDYENYSKDRQTLNDYVSSINDGEKSDEIETQELVSKETVEVQEEPKEEVVLEEKVENIEDKEKVKEIVEEKIDVVENTKVEKEEVCEETVNENLSPLEKYRLEKQKEKAALLEERQKLIDEGTLSEDNDPLKKYRRLGVRSGKVEARVPTIKEQEKEKERKALGRKQNRLNKQKK